jgi:hypothetical protein
MKHFFIFPTRSLKFHLYLFPGVILKQHHVTGTGIRSAGYCVQASELPIPLLNKVR